MKTLLISLVLISLAACSSTMPTKTGDVESNISIKHDKFENSTWIETPMYLSRQGLTDTFPVELKFRAFYKQEQLQFLQLYIMKTDVEWGFYHSAIGEDGTKLEFVKVDKDVSSSSNIVTVKEHFALNMPLEYLKKMSSQNWEIKVYGKRNEGVFIVSPALTKAFMSKLECYSAQQCN